MQLATIFVFNSLSECRRPLDFVLDVQRQRHALRRLSAAELVDIGLCPTAARREARRAWWDLPWEQYRSTAAERLVRWKA